jgi:sulfide:quinone oxidoreductase
MKRIVILGAGTAGTLMANRLVRLLPRETHQITLVDRDDLHIYQPGLLFLPFGDEREADLLRSRRSVLDSGIALRFAEIDRIAPDESRVHLVGSEPVSYDVLIIATGTRIMPEQTPGLTGPGWRASAFDFYTLDGARALAEKLDGFTGGRVVVNVVDMPIKCPVAPLEFLFLAESYFRKRGLRDKVEIVYATPLEGAFTKPRASAVLGGMLENRGIGVIGDFGLAEVDGERGVLKAYDGRETNYDLLVSVPLHGGAQAVTDSGLGDGAGFVPTDKHTLQSKAFPNIFALGDATDLPSSKAGAVAHFQGDVLVSNIARYLAGKPLDPGFDGHANCFIETGDGKAMLIDFNYDTEPLPGRFPLPGIGPFTLLEESARNHWGKLAFKWVYWNLLVQGKELPIDHRMTLAGKWS